MRSTQIANEVAYQTTQNATNQAKNTTINFRLFFFSLPFLHAVLHRTVSLKMKKLGQVRVSPARPRRSGVTTIDGILAFFCSPSFFSFLNWARSFIDGSTPPVSGARKGAEQG